MEEQELFARYRQTHDLALRNEIVERNLHIAAMIAKKFVGRGVEYDDLFQVASLALLKGVDRYDETKGIKFSTFITPTIAGEIKNYFRDRSRLIHLPRNVTELRARAKSAAEELFALEGREPSVSRIAEKIGVSEEEVVSAMEAGGVVSLDRPAGGEEGGGALLELIPDRDDAFDQIEREDVVRAALKELPQKERELVAYRFGQELSQTETAKRMNVSQMYVSRLERKVLEKLRDSLRKSLAE